MKSSSTQENPLGILPVNQLLARFAIPSIIAMLVSALYNIVDQFYIGRSVGMLSPYHHLYCHLPDVRHRRGCQF